jgi:hypothetical protein
MFTFGFFYYGFQTIFSEYHLQSFGGMVVFYGMGMVITYQLNRLNKLVTPRELSERQLLIEKVTKELSLALDKQIDSVYIVVEKKMHPTAGVYYNVVTREN